MNMQSNRISRRRALQTAALATTTLAVAPQLLAQAREVTASATAVTKVVTGPHTLPPLPYAYDALEPHLDARTMEIHHARHHQAYVNNLNNALADFPDLQQKSLADLLKNLHALPEKIRTTVRNNGGGHHNHSWFWQTMKRNGGGEPRHELARAIETSFGSFAVFREQFTQAALRVFGSGWAWLVGEGTALAIESTPNQDSPLFAGRESLLGLDVWEHAYYLKFQNRRADYITAWWNVVNWDAVAEAHARLKR